MQPTLEQFASLFNVFGSLMVLLVSIVTLKLRPVPFFRSWILAYAFAILATVGVSLQTLQGPSTQLLSFNISAATFATWFELRMAQQLLGRPFAGWRVAAILMLFFATCMGLWLTGNRYEACIVPLMICLLGTHLWLGSVMCRVGRTPEYAGMAWVGVPVILHGLWLITYPVCSATPYFWADFGVEALMEVGVGIGMAMFVLHRTAFQLEQQNRSLQIAEQALREAQVDRDRLQKQRIAHLEETDQLKRDLLDTTSHELRTPLTSIIGYAEFLEEEIGGPLVGEQPEYVAQIKKGAARMRRIVDDMLDCARLEAGMFRVTPRRFDLRILLQYETSSLRPQAHEMSVKLDIEIPNEPIDTFADPQSVGQVLLNLASNGLKFTPPGGTVRVRARQVGATIRVEVVDSGIGIALEHRQHIFEKFYQVDPSATRERGGTGLGLAICKALVEAQHGQIGVDSELGQGSTFWFTLPVFVEADFLAPATLPAGVSSVST
jgi:signal transduction histidine kinase